MKAVRIATALIVIAVTGYGLYVNRLYMCAMSARSSAYDDMSGVFGKRPVVPSVTTKVTQEWDQCGLNDLANSWHCILPIQYFLAGSPVVTSVHANSQAFQR